MHLLLLLLHEYHVPLLLLLHVHLLLLLIVRLLRVYHLHFSLLHLELHHDLRLPLCGRDILIGSAHVHVMRQRLRLKSSY